MTSLAALSVAANEMPYWTGAGVMGKTALTSQARTLLESSLLSRSGNNYVFDSDARITGGAVTQSVIDTTNNRLVKVADFGIGATDQGNVVSLTDGHQVLPNGLYAGSGSNADIATFPVSAARFRPFLNMNRRIGPGSFSSIRMFFNNNGAPVFQERDGADIWSPPFLAFGNLNILGTVSQSAGVPTGAIIERGSNSNGEFVRFADGTQICTSPVLLTAATIASGPLYRSNDVGWSYPSAFIKAPVLSGHCLNESNRWVTIRRNSPLTSAILRAYAPSSNATAWEFQIVAIGRWF